MIEAGCRSDPRVVRARKLRRDVTDAEKLLWQSLRALPLVRSHFRRQATIGPYFADFACHQSKIVIELDGSQHSEGATVAHDAKRTAHLNAAGYRVLRFWNNEVLSNLKGVLSTIVDAIPATPRPPTPDPSPPLATLAGGGELRRARGRTQPTTNKKRSTQ